MSTLSGKCKIADVEQISVVLDVLKVKIYPNSKTSTDTYYAAILFETEDFQKDKEGKIFGIDLGLISLVTVFDGET